MLLSLTATMPDARDLGHLLHKHPDRVQSTSLGPVTAHVFFPEATDDRCTVALLLEVDPLGLRDRRRGTHGGLGEYVDDRPYATSALFAVALGKVFSTARAGRSQSRPELAARPLPLTVEVPCLSSRGGAELVRRLFEPLGWRVEADDLALDETREDWGSAHLVRLRLTGHVRLADALNHLYVLVPVLDRAKHYWVDDTEVDKLVRAGAGWLHQHPERELIGHRYLAERRGLADAALARLAELDGELGGELVTDPDPDTTAAADERTVPEPAAPAPIPLRTLRHDAVLSVVREVRPARVLDLGCGSGALLGSLLAEPGVRQVVGVDVSASALDFASRRLRVAEMPERTSERLALWQSSLLYRDARLTGFDLAVLMEVIEHVEPDRLAEVERNVFGEMRPGVVVVTTPNAEANLGYPGLAGGGYRHSDHRFEWTQAEFGEWARRMSTTYGYVADLRPVGAVDPDLGPATQMAVFRAGTDG